HVRQERLGRGGPHAGREPGRRAANHGAHRLRRHRPPGRVRAASLPRLPLRVHHQLSPAGFGPAAGAAGGRLVGGTGQSRPTAPAAAAATSPSAGYSSDRPASRPRTFGSRSAFRHPANAPAGSSETSPPSSSAGRVEAAMTRSMSGTTGTLSHV